jgi:TetR/AcrR family hemagglutinin/protease transcriptional regulator
MDQETRKKPARAARLDPAQRRAQLLACAITAFAAVGVSRAGHAEVARRAGVSVPTVFVYFPTREALVDAVLGEVGRYIVEDVLRPVQDRAADAPQLLIDTALAFTEAVGTHPDLARVWLDWSTAFRGDVWPLYLEFQARVFEVLRPTVLRGKRDGTLAPTLDADDATRLLVGSAHMLAQMKFTGCESAQVENFVRTLVDGFRAAG